MLTNETPNTTPQRQAVANTLRNTYHAIRGTPDVLRGVNSDYKGDGVITV